MKIRKFLDINYHDSATFLLKIVFKGKGGWGVSKIDKILQVEDA